jgi:hypothetical protein
MLKHFMLLPLLVLPCLTRCSDTAGGRAQAAGSHSIRVETTSQGIRLTLIVPGSIYPKDALVQVTLLLRNVSHHPVRLDESCGHRPFAEVTSRSGKQIYPLMFHPMPAIVGGCFGTAYPRIAPGHTLVMHQYVVLLGSGVRGSDPTGRIETKPAVVSLVPGERPGVIVTTRGGVHATVAPPPGARGPLWFLGWSSCVEHGIPYTEVDRNWLPNTNGIAAPQFHSADCQRIIEWHAFAGYLNHPIATIDYKFP